VLTISSFAEFVECSDHVVCVCVCSTDDSTVIIKSNTDRVVTSCPMFMEQHWLRHRMSLLHLEHVLSLTY